MAYSLDNPAVLQIRRLGDQVSAQFVYVSTDNAGAVIAADYFTNGGDLGMKINDVVVNVDTDGAVTLHRVSAISAAGAVTVV